MSHKKLAFICAKGLDSFLDPVIEGLADDYWVRRIIVTSQKQIHEAIDWADIVWLEWCNEVAIYATHYEGIAGKKVIIRLHSYEALSDLPRQISWQAVDKLIFVAPHIRAILQEAMPELEGLVETRIVYNGVEPEKVPSSLRKPGYDIAWVGYVNHKKNPSLMLQIVKDLVEIDARYKLHVAGSFQERRYEVYMQHMIRELGLRNNVVFHGWVDDMDTFWEGMSFLLHTSVHEGHSYAIMEAMARGIKPVIHNFRGAKELYREEWLFNTSFEAVEKMLFNGDFPYHIGEYNSQRYRQWVIDHGWTLKNQVQQTKTILEGEKHGSHTDNTGLLRRLPRASKT